MDDDFFSAGSAPAGTAPPVQTGGDDDFFGGGSDAAPISPSGGQPQAAPAGGDDDFFGGAGAGSSDNISAQGSANQLPTAGSGFDDFGAPSSPVAQPAAQEEAHEDAHPAIEEVEDEEPQRQTSAAAGSAASFGFDAEPQQAEGRVPELEVDVVESQGSSHSIQAGGSSASLGQPAASPTAQSPVSPNPMDAPIPDKKAELSPVDKWNVEMRQDMINRDQAANQKRDEMKKEAQKALDEFHSQRKQLIESNHARNVQAEEEFCKQRDELFAHGGVWERVASLVDLKSSTDKKQSRTARMKSLLLLMKNEKAQ